MYLRTNTPETVQSNYTSFPVIVEGNLPRVNLLIRHMVAVLDKIPLLDSDFIRTRNTVDSFSPHIRNT
jgi:hypothetical protein